MQRRENESEKTTHNREQLGFRGEATPEIWNMISEWANPSTLEASSTCLFFRDAMAPARRRLFGQRNYADYFNNTPNIEFKTANEEGHFPLHNLRIEFSTANEEELIPLHKLHYDTQLIRLNHNTLAVCTTTQIHILRLTPNASNGYQAHIIKQIDCWQTNGKRDIAKLDQTHFVVAGSHEISIFNWQTGECIKNFIYPCPINTMTTTKDNHIVIGDEQGNVTIYDRDISQKIKQFRDIKHLKTIHTLPSTGDFLCKFFLAGKHFNQYDLTLYDQAGMALWYSNTEKEGSVVACHTNNEMTLFVTEDPSDKQTWHVYQLIENHATHVCQLKGMKLSAFAISADNQYIFCNDQLNESEKSPENNLKIFDLKTGDLIKAIPLGNDKIGSMATLPNGNLVATLGSTYSRYAPRTFCFGPRLELNTQPENTPKYLNP